MGLEVDVSVPAAAVTEAVGFTHMGRREWHKRVERT